MVQKHAGTSPRGRDTLRQRIIRSVLAERGAMLLDELRWTVLRRELGSRLDEITASRMTSFLRTVRNHLTREIRTWEVALNDRRLVAAMAVYRLRHRPTLEGFLHGKSPRAIYSHTLERYGGVRRVHYFHQVDLHAVAGGPLLQRVTIPWSHQAVIVGMGAAWTYEQVLGTANWEFSWLLHYCF